jgi:splicing factor 3B subunit 5
MSHPSGQPIPIDQLRVKYGNGIGHADITKYEWVTSQHRDTYASLLGHYDQLSYHAVATNESIARLRLEYLEKMILPCGLPPKKQSVTGVGTTTEAASAPRATPTSEEQQPN